MPARGWLPSCLLWAALSAAAPVQAAEPVQVMVLGSYHFANPGKDLHNAQVDDVLAPHRQTELQAVVQGLARFAPHRVIVEAPTDATPGHAVPAYADYLAGQREASRNEIDQIGFRLARTLGHTQVLGIDVAGDFPFASLQAYAQQQGQAAALQAQVDQIGQRTRAFEQLQTQSTIGQLLRFINQPSRLLEDHAWYVQALRWGHGNQQPGAHLVASWYTRNLGSCARLVQRVQPGQRVLVLYGSGHAYLLRRCVLEMPGWQLIEPAAYLPG